MSQEQEVVPPKPYSRREFLTLSGLLGAKLALNLIAPPSAEAQEADGFSPVTVRKGDTVYGLCRFYGIPEGEIASKVELIAQRNKLSDVNIIHPGKLYLPISFSEVELPFKNFAYQLEGNQYATRVSMTTDAKGFQSDVSVDNILYVPVWPYSFWGHSAEKGASSVTLPFHGLLRELLKDTDRVKIWFSRSITSDKDSWVRCRIERNEVNYLGGTDNDDLSRKIWDLPFSSRSLMLCTCATERGKYDRLIALGSLDYGDTKPPPIAGL